jgi:hypothetical protein
MVGSELVTNGTFDSNVSGWTQEPGTSGTITYQSGVARVTRGGGSGPSFYQAISTQVGKSYVVSATLNGVQTRIDISARTNVFGSGGTTINRAVGTSGQIVYGIFTFVAVGTTTYLYMDVDNNGAYGEYDNITCRLADPDRSVNAKGLQVFGSITKSAVATGADLVAYSGFSSSNYLMQPYNALLDFTGDFSWSLWYYHVTNSATEYILYRAPFANGQPKTEIFINTDNTLGIYIQDLGALASPAIQPNSWHHIIATRRSGIVSFYLNSVLVNSGASTVNLTNTNAILSLGLRTSGGYNGINGRLALVRASATAPSAEQIAKIYEDEKYLFQENAKATLYGASDAVTALAYDEDTRLLHVGTSSGRSVFNGLRRVDNTTTAVSASISAVAGLVAEQ